MSLSLLSPLAAALSLLVALPILAHLTRQRPTERLAYGAMLLVQRLVKRLRRRRALKDVLLMALRIAAVLLAVAAAAAPRLSWKGDIPTFEGSGRMVLLLDQSLSMALVDGGSTLLERAKAEASARVRSTPDGARFGVVAFGPSSRALTTEMTDDKNRVLALIADLQPTMGAGDLRGAMLDARRLLAGEKGEVFVFSDEAGPSMIPEAEEEIGRVVALGSAVLPVPIHADPPRNLAVTAAHYGDGIEGGQLTFRVANYGPTTREAPCEVVLPDGQSIPVFVDAPAGGEAEARVTIPRQAASGVGRVTCDDPDLALDDSRWFHLPQVGASRVLIVDGDPGDTPVRSEVYFLERALAPWGGSSNGVVPEVVSPKGLGALDPTTHRLVFLANVADPGPFGARLRDFVRRGGSVVISVGDNITADRYNAALAGLLPSPFRGPESLADRAEEPVPLELPDTSRAPFEPFARGGRGAFTHIGAWRVMTLEPYADSGDVRTLLRFTGGVPALVSRDVGQGHVLVWTSSIDLGWSNLPLQAAFVPLTQRIAGWLGAESDGAVARVEATIGARVEVPLSDGISDVDVRGPDGSAVRATLQSGRAVFTADKPGAYEVRVTDGPRVGWVAVNLDAEESDVRRTKSLASVEAALDPEMFVRHQDLAEAAMGLSMVLLLAGALLAAFTGAAT